MKYSVCLDAVYAGGDVADSMRHVHEAGYGAVEFWSWWDKDCEAVAQAAERLGLQIAAFCTKFVPLTEPQARARYLEGLRESIQVAGRLRCNTLITQTGPDTGAPREEQRQCLLDGLRACVPLLEESGVTLVVEPLNTKLNHPGYFLSASKEAFDLIDEVGAQSVRVLYDIYHQQITEGDILRSLLPNLDKAGHIHAAGAPGRHELTQGELNYPNIFRQLRAAGYEGYVGLEYSPQQAPEEGLRAVLNW